MSGKDDGWTPRHVVTTGHDGSDCCDLFEAGITGERYLQWLKEHIAEGPPKINVKPKEKKKKPTVKKSEPVTEAKNTSNVVPIHQPDEELDYGMPPEYSEDALAEEFTRKYENVLKFSGTENCWYNWDGHIWSQDRSGIALDKARKVCKVASSDVMARQELGRKVERISNTLSSRRMFANVEAIARTDRKHVVTPTKFDSRTMILNTPKGVVDLKTGELRPARKDDFCTLTTACAPDGEQNCPKWFDYLEDATQGDTELKTYLQRVAGYCLTGSVNEHAFFFCYGGGGNGKGTYINTIDFLMGSYSKVANMDTFVATRHTAHPEELAELYGARLVTAQEPDAGSRWNEARIKTLTGGDPITARKLYQSSFTFYPTFKLLFSGNHKPMIKNVDAAIRRRMYLIPFDFKVPDEKRDGGLQDYLKQVEGPGILQWAIEGCLDWQLNTLNAPERVRVTTDEYFEDEDRIGVFFAECCEIGTGYREVTTRLYQRYRDWMQSNGEYAVSRKRFLESLAQKGFYSRNRGGQMSVEGIQLPVQYDPDVPF
jgi:putative DNA primase/helicase